MVSSCVRFSCVLAFMGLGVAVVSQIQEVGDCNFSTASIVVNVGQRRPWQKVTLDPRPEAV